MTLIDSEKAFQKRCDELNDGLFEKLKGQNINSFSTLAFSYFFTYSAILPFLTYLVQNFHYKIGTCGTHFGETKLVVSIDDKPVSESRSISFIFVSVGTIFCQKKSSNN